MFDIVGGVAVTRDDGETATATVHDQWDGDEWEEAVMRATLKIVERDN